jgi:hypothetical protein
VWTVLSILIGLRALGLIFKGLFGGSASSGVQYVRPSSRAAMQTGMPASKAPTDGAGRKSTPLPSTTDWWGTDRLFAASGDSQTSSTPPPRPSTPPAAVTPPTLEVPKKENPPQATPAATQAAPGRPEAGSPAPTPLVFISYSSRNEGLARGIVAELEKDGLTCWFAARDNKPGARGYHTKILDAIEQSWLVVVLCSRDAVASSHVLNELEQATALKRPMLPVLIEGFDPTDLGDFRYFLNRFQRVRLPAPPGTVSRMAAEVAHELGVIL